ncbi:MAG: ribonuclease R, partial [Dysgonamonadaceae bacterium]|nr:ribonuclease R [Dysgonamonadaceae bacterium]
MPKKKKNKALNSVKPLNKKQIVNRVVQLFNSHPKEKMNYKQVSAEIGVDAQEDKQYVAALLADLLQDEFLVEVDRGKYR